MDRNDGSGKGPGAGIRNRGGGNSSGGGGGSFGGGGFSGGGGSFGGGFSGNHSSGGDLPSSDNGGGHGGRGGPGWGMGPGLFLLAALFAAVAPFGNTVETEEYMVLDRLENEIGMDEADVDKVFGKQHWPGRRDGDDAKREEAMPEPGKEKLPEESCIRSDQVMDDRLGWISDTRMVGEAMDYFYAQTGVQPYLLICDSFDGKGETITDEEAHRYLQELYDSLYEDEGHMIFAFMEYAESEYYTYLYTGRTAVYIMDEEARGTFLEYADWFYTDSSLSDDTYFAEIFRRSADRIIQEDT